MLLLIAFLFSGIAISQAVFGRKERPITRIWLGLVFGCVELMWLPAVIACITRRFTMTEQIVAVCLALAAAAGCVVFSVLQSRRDKNAVTAETAPLPETQEEVTGDANGEEAKPKKRFFSGLSGVIAKWEALGIALALAVTILCGFLLGTHVIEPAEDGSVHVGQSTYGDLCMHLGMVENLYAQGDFPPEYNILPGQRINYPFLVNAASATLRFGGLSLRGAVIAPSVVMIFCVALGFFMLAYKITSSPMPSVIAFLAFFLDGGFGFAYFLDKVRSNPDNFFRIFTAFYETPTNYTSVGNVKWVNSICDMIIPQRTTMAGWCVLMAGLWLLASCVQKICDENEKAPYGRFVILGVLGGLMPMIHTHSMFALGMISAGVFFTVLWPAIKKGRGLQWFLCFCVFGAVTAALAMPQLFTWTFNSTSESGFLQYHLDWANSDDNWLWFWIKNGGVVFLFLLPALIRVFRGGTPEQRGFAVGSLLIFAVSSVFVFQPNYYDNNKLLFVWFMVACVLAADYMVAAYRALRGVHGREVIVIGLVLAMTLSGALTVGREIVSDYQLESAEEVAAARYISRYTEPDAVFMTYPNHNNAVAVLTGRRIVVGAGTFLYFHGVDYQSRQAKVKEAFESGDAFTEYAGELGVDYVYISNWERSNYEVDEQWFAANCNLVYDRGGVRIYKVR